jgi:DNA-binding LacI/PurR family transcriptional regulator
MNNTASGGYDMKSEKRLHFGVIFSTLDNANQYEIWGGIAEYAQKNDIHLTAYFGTYQMTINDSTSHLETCFDTIRNSVSLDGVIMFSGFIAHIIGNEKFEKYAGRIPKRLPLVSVSYVLPGVPSVIVDNIAGMYSAIDHLIKAHGKRRIVFVKGPDGHPEAEDRLEGYKRALEANGIAYDDRYVFRGNFDRESGRNAVKRLIESPELRADAIAASNDVSAMGILGELKSNNFVAPSDFAVTGFDDEKVSASFIPSISSVKQDFHEFGHISAELLHNRIDGKPVDKITFVPSAFMARQSCGCLEKEFLSEEPACGGDDDKKDSLLSYVADKFMPLFRQDVPEPQIRKWSEGLVALIKENPFSKEKFLCLLNENLIRYNQYSKNTLIWNKALGVLSVGTELHGDEVTGANAIRSTLSYAETFVHGIRFKEREFREFGLNDIRWTGRRIAGNLVLIFDIDSLALELHKALPGISIDTALIGLFHKPIKSGDPKANRTIDRLIGFDGPQEFNIKINGRGPIQFSDYSTIENFDFESRRRVFFFIPLFFKDEEYGIMLMPYDPDISVDTYESLRINISTAVKGAELINEIRYQNDLLNAVNDAAAILFDPDVEKFDKNIVDAMGVVARAINVSRMCIWKNRNIGGESGAALLYEWKTGGDFTLAGDRKIELRYCDGFLEWKKTLSRGE